MSTGNTYNSLTYSISGNQVIITDCEDSVTNVVVPAQINGMNVVEIASYAFQNCAQLKSLMLPEG